MANDVIDALYAALCAMKIASGLPAGAMAARTPWKSIPEHQRENWRCVADRQIIARLTEAGYRIVEGD